MELRPAKTCGIASGAEAELQARRMIVWEDSGTAFACFSEGEVGRVFRFFDGVVVVGVMVFFCDGVVCELAALVVFALLSFCSLSSVRLAVGVRGADVVCRIVFKYVCNLLYTFGLTGGAGFPISSASLCPSLWHAMWQHAYVLPISCSGFKVDALDRDCARRDVEREMSSGGR